MAEAQAPKSTPNIASSNAALIGSALLEHVQIWRMCRFGTHLTNGRLRRATNLFNRRFDSERKISQPSSGFRIRSRCTIGGYGSCSRRRRKPHILIVATFHTGKISTAEQSSRGLGDRNKKLLRFIQSSSNRRSKLLWVLTTFVIPEGFPIKPLIASILAGGTGLPATIASAIPRNTWRSARAFL